MPHRAEVVYGDLMQPETMRQPLHNIDAMYLILSSDVAGADLETDAQVIALAEEAGVKHVSLLTVYGDGLVEQALRNSTMTSTFVQPVGFMANCLDDWQDTIRNGEVIEAFGGHIKTAIIHEGDIGAVVAETLVNEDHYGQFYTLTGPELRSKKECVDMISHVLRTSISFKELSLDEARKRWKDAGYDDESIQFFVQMGTQPPEIGTTILPTVEKVLKRPPKRFSQWVNENKNQFS
ncbi:SDR family oxidoreductase [Geomicrobium sp. JCM 19037]|uniref:SDR family oxidoreductase n=1 Tax=Geomicrobium sp. JCM 19037 TaxID=1460634 RepID=UPI001EE6743B|nr:hydroxylase [Geomicrobium sp. JCM 19037]